MTKTYFIAGLMVAIALGLFIMAGDDLGTYSTFGKAKDDGGRVKIAGQLVKDKDIIYDPAVDPNFFSFFIEDTDGVERKVILLQPKPQDFELSEQIVLTGRMKEDDTFVATDVLLKCPSKYKDEELYLKEKES